MVRKKRCLNKINLQQLAVPYCSSADQESCVWICVETAESVPDLELHSQETLTSSQWWELFRYAEPNGMFSPRNLEKPEIIRIHFTGQVSSFVVAPALLRLAMYCCISWLHHSAISSPTALSPDGWQKMKMEHKCLSGGPEGKIMSSVSTKSLLYGKHT